MLSAALAPLAGRVKLAFVFGSVARGEEAAGSDVDVLLVGDAGFRDVVEALHPTQATLGREVNPKVFALDEFAAKARSEPFLRDVLSRPKIFLIGNADELEELAGHQP
jgi:predicted nucleotidyltransferase